MPKVLQVAVNLLCGVCRPVAPSLARSLFTEAAGGGLALASPAAVNVSVVMPWCCSVLLFSSRDIASSPSVW